MPAKVISGFDKLPGKRLSAEKYPKEIASRGQKTPDAFAEWCRQ